MRSCPQSAAKDLTLNSMHFIYLSPHLDDVALSCGGLVWEQSHAGAPVEVWTICAGDPPEGPLSPFAQSLQKRWQTGLQPSMQRRQEDLASCQLLGAAAKHFPIPDCIYRQAEPGGHFLYTTEESLTGPLDPAEQPLLQRLRYRLAAELPASSTFVCPLALGGHVDHRLVRQAAELLNRRLYYYADYPYILQQPEALSNLLQEGWSAETYPISPVAMAAWEDSVAAHISQVSTFWSSLDEMRLAMLRYCQEQSGVSLYGSPQLLPSVDS